MRHHYLSLTASTLLVLGYSHAALADSTPEEAAHPDIACFSTLGSVNDHNKEYHLTKDLTCDFSAAPTDTNAAITVLGKNATLNLNGHTINCINSPETGNATDPTANLASIGVHLAGSHSKLNGANRKGDSEISGCQVAVEIGTAPIVEGHGGHHQVTHVNATQCAAGFRVLGDKNLVKSNQAECGIIDPELDNPSAGFVLGIRVKQPELQPMPVNDNLLTLNIAYKNNIGFWGLNSSKIDDDTLIYKTTNVMSYNKANDNIDGFSIEGSGHQITHNLSKSNSDAGINVTQRNPVTAPPAGSVMNEITENKTLYNDTYGINVGRANPAANFGNILKANFASGNTSSDPDVNGYDLFDANSTCAEHISDLSTLNIWKWNVATGDVDPACTVIFSKDADK